jgi:hypothetical protein
VSDAELTCSAPPSSVTGTVPLTVHVVGEGAPVELLPHVELAYYARIVVDAVAPGVGPSTGGTTLTVSGTGLVVADGVTYSCVFRMVADDIATSVPMSVRVNDDGSSVGICDTPAFVPGVASVAVVDSGGHTSLPLQLVFHAPVPEDVRVGDDSAEQYHPHPSPVELTDEEVIAAEVQRRLLDAEFSAQNPVFGVPTPLPAVDVTDAVLVVPPRDTYDGSTDEVVTVAGTITLVSPLSGPTRGDTLVVVIGTNLPAVRTTLGLASDDAALQPFCLFGAVEMPAVVVDVGTSLTCTSPHTDAEGTVVFSVRYRVPNTPLFVDVQGPALAFTYYFAPYVRKLTPSSGPVQGGTRVTVLGGYFVQHKTTLRFRCSTGVPRPSRRTFCCTTSSCSSRRRTRAALPPARLSSRSVTTARTLRRRTTACCSSSTGALTWRRCSRTSATTWAAPR